MVFVISLRSSAGFCGEKLPVICITFRSKGLTCMLDKPINLKKKKSKKIVVLPRLENET